MAGGGGEFVANTAAQMVNGMAGQNSPTTSIMPNDSYTKPINLQGGEQMGLDQLLSNFQQYKPKGNTDINGLLGISGLPSYYGGKNGIS